MGNRVAALILVAGVGLGLHGIHLGSPVTVKVPHLSMPTIEGQATTTSNLDKLQSGFNSRQGYVAGETPYQGIYVHQVKRSVKWIPAGLMGSCATMKNGRGAVTYYVDKSATTTPVTGDDAHGYVVTLPEPQPLAVAITSFDSGAIKKAKTCGVLGREDIDGQAINREVLAELCHLAATDKTHLTEREHDAEAMVKSDGEKWGTAQDKIKIAWTTPATPPPPLQACIGLL